jgi:DNA-binding transcriptional regulator/RsmH inhibitor MraZ
MTSANQAPTFTSTHISAVDDLGRVLLPQVWREALAEREVGIILLSDGRDEHRLVVYPCPGGVSGTFPPAPTPAWGVLPPRGEFVHTVDCKGRFCTPTPLREHCQGKLLLLKGCQDHFVASLHERMSEDVDMINGVREYLWPESARDDVLPFLGRTTDGELPNRENLERLLT